MPPLGFKFWVNQTVTFGLGRSGVHFSVPVYKWKLGYYYCLLYDVVSTHRTRQQMGGGVGVLLHSQHLFAVKY